MRFRAQHIDGAKKATNKIIKYCIQPWCSWVNNATDWCAPTRKHRKTNFNMFSFLFNNLSSGKTHYHRHREIILLLLLLLRCLFSRLSTHCSCNRTQNEPNKARANSTTQKKNETTKTTSNLTEL